MIPSDVNVIQIIGIVVVLGILMMPVMAEIQTVQGDQKVIVNQLDQDSAVNQEMPGITEVNSWITKGEKELQTSKYQDALDSFNHALIACNEARIFGVDKSRALIGKGNAFLGLSRPKEALTVFSQAYDLDPLNPASLIGQGDASTALTQYQEALLAYNRVLEINLTNPSVLVKKGTTLGLQGRSQAAIDAYKKAIQIQPGNAEAWGGEGSQLASLNRHQEAVEAYNQSLKYNPQNADTWINAGKSLWILGLYQESLDSYNHALTLRPDDATAREGKETVSSLISRYKKAVSQTA